MSIKNDTRPQKLHNGSASESVGTGVEEYRVILPLLWLPAAAQEVAPCLN